MSKNPYITQIDTIVERAPINSTWQTVTEAQGYIKAINQVKKELGLVKKQITADKRQIHAGYANQRNHVGKGFAGGAMRGLFGAKNAGRASSATRNSLRNQELNALRPQEEAIQYLERAIVGLDKMKLEMETWVMQYKRG